MILSQIHNGKCFGFTVFHDCAIPPDEFVANCQLNLEDLATSKVNDVWVSVAMYDRKNSLFCVSTLGNRDHQSFSRLDS